jgi:hypothetical protein
MTDEETGFLNLTTKSLTHLGDPYTLLAIFLTTNALDSTMRVGQVEVTVPKDFVDLQLVGVLLVILIPRQALRHSHLRPLGAGSGIHKDAGLPFSEKQLRAAFGPREKDSRKSFLNMVLQTSLWNIPTSSLPDPHAYGKASPFALP